MYAQYKNEWTKENRDRFMLTMPKGKKQEIKAIAEARGKSLTKYINEAIDAYAERE